MERTVEAIALGLLLDAQADEQVDALSGTKVTTAAYAAAAARDALLREQVEPAAVAPTPHRASSPSARGAPR